MPLKKFNRLDHRNGALELADAGHQSRLRHQLPSTFVNFARALETVHLPPLYSCGIFSADFWLTAVSTIKECRADMDFLVRFVQVHESFRKPELEALAELQAIHLKVLQYQPDVRQFRSLIEMLLF